MTESIEDLRKICQSIDKFDSHSPLTKKYFARKVSIYITKMLLYTSITANQVTFIAFVIAFLSGLLLASGIYSHMFVGALLLELYYIFDHVDGEIARYRKSSSLTGMYLDYVMNYVVHPLIFASLTVGTYISTNDLSFLIFGFMSTIGVILIDLVSDLAYKIIVTHYVSVSKKPQTKINTRINSISLADTFPWLNRFISILRILPYRVPGLINVVLMVTAFDFLQEMFQVTTPIRFTKYFIISYGILSTLIWLSTFVLYVKGRHVERLLEIQQK